MVRTNTFEDADCATAEYYELPNGQISVNNFEFDIYNPERNKPFDTFRPFVAACSTWQKGACHVTPFWLVEYASYNVIATDHTSYSIVHTCANYFGPAIKVESFWVLTRKALAKNSAGWTEMWSKVKPIIDQTIPWVDQSNIYFSQQTVAEGCKYAPRIVAPPLVVN